MNQNNFQPWMREDNHYPQVHEQPPSLFSQFTQKAQEAQELHQKLRPIYDILDEQAQPKQVFMS